MPTVLERKVLAHSPQVYYRLILLDAKYEANFTHTLVEIFHTH